MDLTKLHLHWRVSQYKGKKYRSYSLARAFRAEGKNRKEIFLKLGKLSDKEAERWRAFLKFIKTQNSFVTTIDNIAVTKHFDYLDLAVANSIWDEWRLSEVFSDDDKRDVSIATIARLLTINRCVDPAAKSRIPEWFRGTALSWQLGVDSDSINPSRIFRELIAIENHKEAICQHLYQWMKYSTPDSMKSVFYDLSSTTFSGSHCILSKWGHCKEGYHEHIVLALVVNRDGLPFYWETLKGGTADSKTISWLLGRLKERFGESETTLVFDRGMVSDDNLDILETSKIKYISAMDRNQLEGITGIDFTTFSHLTPELINVQSDELVGFQQLGDNTYCKEIKVEEKRRYILCFNPQLFKDQRKARKQAIADFHEFVFDLNTDLMGAKKSRQRKATSAKFERKLAKTKLKAFVDVKLETIKVGSGGTVRTYKAKISVDSTLMNKAGKLDGFWLLVTNHTEKGQGEFKMSTMETIKPYREKTVIESSFRDIKSFVEIKPVYVWSETHVKAHYTCCVLSHLINRVLTLRLHKNKGSTSKAIVSHEKLYQELSDCKIDKIEVENIGLTSYNMTRPTKDQKDLLNRIGLTKLLSLDVVKKARAI